MTPDPRHYSVAPSTTPPDHGTGRYITSVSIPKFSSLMSELVGANLSATMRYPMGHALDSEFVDAIVTLGTVNTPSPETVGTMRFSIEVGTDVVAPVEAADGRGAFRALTKGGGPQVTGPTDAYTGRRIQVEPLQGSINYLAPIYLRIDLTTPDPSSPFQVWNNIGTCAATLVFEEMWVRRDNEVRTQPRDIESYRNRSQQWYE